MNYVTVQQAQDFGMDLREEMLLLHDAAAEDDFLGRDLKNLTDAGLGNVIRERIPKRMIIAEFISGFPESILNRRAAA